MRDDERLFSIGIQFFMTALLIVALFHMMFDITDKRLKAKNREIVSLEQDLSNAKVRFETMTRPETLRPIVSKIFPTWRHIGTDRVISVKNL